jgi:hypothetical protein
MANYDLRMECPILKKVDRLKAAVVAVFFFFATFFFVEM